MGAALSAIGLGVSILRRRSQSLKGKAFLIVGLGNPGDRYRLTRHNAGFLALDLLSKSMGLSWKRNKAFQAEVCIGREGLTPLILAKPQTYMNASGIAVAALAKYYDIPIKNIIIVTDDLALTPGMLRIRSKGSSGGHNGLKSIIAAIGDGFIRVRLGVGHPGEQMEVVDYVLQRFTAADWEKVQEAIERSIHAIRVIIEEGVEQAMNRFNRKAEME